MGSLDAFRTSQGDLHQDDHVEPDSCLMLPIPVISVLFLEDRNGKTRYCMVLGTVFVGSEDKVFSKCSKPLISLDVINSHFSTAIQTIKISGFAGHKILNTAHFTSNRLHRPCDLACKLRSATFLHCGLQG